MGIFTKKSKQNPEGSQENNIGMDSGNKAKKTFFGKLFDFSKKDKSKSAYADDFQAKEEKKESPTANEAATKSSNDTMIVDVSFTEMVSDKVADKVENDTTDIFEKQISTKPKSRFRLGLERFLLGLGRLPSVFVNRNTLKNASIATVITGGIVGVTDALLHGSISNIEKYAQEISSLIMQNYLVPLIGIPVIYFSDKLIAFITRRRKELPFKLSTANVTLYSFFDNVKHKTKDMLYSNKILIPGLGGLFFLADAINASKESDISHGFKKAWKDVISIVVAAAEGITSTTGAIVLSSVLFIGISIKKFKTEVSGAAKRELATIITSLSASDSSDLAELAKKLNDEGNVNPVKALQNSKKLILEKIEADEKQIQQIIQYRVRTNRGVSEKLYDVAAEAEKLREEAQQTDPFGRSDDGRHIGIIAQEMDRLLSEAKKHR